VRCFDVRYLQSLALKCFDSECSGELEMAVLKKNPMTELQLHSLHA